MQFVFNLLSEQSFIAFVQFVVGNWVKQNPKIKNELIPVATFVVGVLGFLVAPATAHAAGALTPLVPGIGVLLSALGQNFFVTGLHSTFKNTLFPALQTTLGWLVGLLTKQSPPPASGQ